MSAFGNCVFDQSKCAANELCDYQFSFITRTFTNYPVCYDPNIYAFNYCTGHCARCTRSAECCGSQTCFDACGTGHDTLFCTDQNQSFCTTGDGDCSHPFLH